MSYCFNKSASVRRRIKWKMFAEQNGRCFYCDGPMILTSRRGPQQATLDHIIPRSEGGTHEQTNLVLACHECNDSRGVMPAHLYLKVRRAWRESLSVSARK